MQYNKIFFLLYLKSGVLPGECWAFKGSQGVAVIQLLGYVQVTGFTLEHVSPLITPTGESNSAPKDFDILVRFYLKQYFF